MKVVISGAIGIGKSTFLEKKLSDCNPNEICGFQTTKIIENNTICGFEFVLFDGKRIPFAHVDKFKSDLKFGKYNVSKKAFQNLSEELFLQYKSKKILVIDELGLMEKSIIQYVNQISLLYSYFDESLIIIQQRALEFWLEHLSIDGKKVCFITENNRNSVLL